MVAARAETREGDRLIPRRQYAEEALPHLDAVYRLAFCLTGGDQAEAEEVTEEVFLLARERWRSAAASADRRLWLLAFCRERIAERRRSRDSYASSMEKLAPATDARVEALAATASLAEIDAALAGRGSFGALADGQLMQAIAELPGSVREAVVLSDVEGLSYPALAEVLGVETDTARSLLFRARRLLQQELYRLALERGDLRPPVRPASGDA